MLRLDLPHVFGNGVHEIWVDLPGDGFGQEPAVKDATSLTFALWNERAGYAARPTTL
jgi:hypothetical protein